jgi:hypothetical protein
MCGEIDIWDETLNRDIAKSDLKALFYWYVKINCFSFFVLEKLGPKIGTDFFSEIFRCQKKEPFLIF